MNDLSKEEKRIFFVDFIRFINAIEWINRFKMCHYFQFKNRSMYRLKVCQLAAIRNRSFTD